MTWLTRLWHTWRIRTNQVDHTPDEHPGLAPFFANERFVLKGVEFRVRARYTDPLPCMVLEPMGSSRNAKLNRLRDLRAEDKADETRLKELRKQAARKWREGHFYVD